MVHGDPNGRDPEPPQRLTRVGVVRRDRPNFGGFATWSSCPVRQKVSWYVAMASESQLQEVKLPDAERGLVCPGSNIFLY